MSMKKWFGSLAIAGLIFGVAGQASAVMINELRIDDIGSDNDEYLELFGTASESLDGLSYIVIGDGSTGSGTIERVIDLAGLSIQSDGFFLAANASLGTDVPFSGTIDLTLASNTFENSDNVTHLLVSGFTGANADDLDTNDDGTLDSTPWASIVDGFSLVETLDVPASGEYFYAASLGLPVIGPDGTFVPGHVYREIDGTGDFLIGAFVSANDTPGASNIPEPASLVLLGLGGVAMLTRRRTQA